MNRDLLEEAVRDVLACPACHADVVLEGTTVIRCRACSRVYPIDHDILVFCGAQPLEQDDERRFRDEFAARCMEQSPRELLGIVAQHHCIPVMRQRAQRFRARVRPTEWLVDVGVGFGWHWMGQGRGGRVIGIDLSMGNLALARRLLAHDLQRVLLICADAAALPIRDKVIGAVWSVQTFQHLPLHALRRAQAELARVVRDEFLIEYYDLNPAWFHRRLYAMLGKRFHCRGKWGAMELNRRSAAESRSLWEDFRNGRVQIRHGYSELFFHPDLHLRPRPYPLWLERLLTAGAPGIAATFARQVHVEIRPASRTP